MTCLLTMRTLFLLPVLIVGWTVLTFAQAASVPANAPVAAPSATNPPAAASVKVTSHGSQLQVTVPDQAALSTVMSSLCQEQKIKCTGTETLATYRNPAMTVEGTLRQVISKLVEGTDINYEFSRSAEGSATAIAFLGHAPKGTTPVPAAPEPVHERPQILHSRPFPGKVPPPQTGPQTPPQAELLPENQVPSSGSQGVVADTATKTGSNSAAAFLSTGTGNTEPARYQPFPDHNGQPIPVNNTPQTMLPFPDRFGNPIPAKPAIGGSPFPVTGSTSSAAAEPTKQ